MNNVLKRFLEYIKIDTISDSSSKLCPSTGSQKKLGGILVEELLLLGLKDASMDENGYIMATLEANTDKVIPTIGFLAHMDTSPDFSGKDINPKIIYDYDGEDIILNKEKNIVLKVSDFDMLKKYKNQTVITTDGTTLLGVDDKAGIAEIITAIEYLVNNPEIKHGTVKIGFTPDEEIGRGADKFDVKKFGADFAYTIDSDEVGVLEYENFNAATGIIKITGVNIHPGSAKNKMINSIAVGMEINQMLPVFEKPEHTENYEGFFHLNDFNGSVENTEMLYIIRDHDKEKFIEKKELLEYAIEYINKKYGDVVELNLSDSYYNMKEKIVDHMHIVDTAREAMEELNIEPIIKPIRGGTDGARLSFMGLPTPNIFTGGGNFHGKYEFIIAESMDKAVEVIVKIVENYGKK